MTKRNCIEKTGFTWQCFEITLPIGTILHATKVKLSLVSNSGERIERIPALIKYSAQNGSECFDGFNIYLFIFI